MNTALITGAGGAVGTALSRHLIGAGVRAIPWNRAEVDPWNDLACQQFLDDIRPDAIFSLAIASQPTGREGEGTFINIRWPARLAEHAHTRNIRFVHTSTVMVYTDDLPGPYTPDTVPDATDGYAGAKIQADRAIREADPHAIIARIGWQIGDAPGSNNMIDYIHKQIDEHGRVTVSARFFPACAHLSDTAAALTDAASAPAGTYLLDANRGWSLFEIMSALRTEHGADWNIQRDEAFAHDQRMLDDRIRVAPLSTRLPLSEHASAP